MHGLQTRIYSLDIKARDEVKATDETLNRIYEASALGLKGANLAYHAGLTLTEFRQLEQLDPRVAEAAVAGCADAEHELATVMMDAARKGDAKTALEILKHKHGWVAQQAIKQELTGVNGGPIQLAAVDMRSLSNEELEQMEKLLEKTVNAPKELPNGGAV